MNEILENINARRSTRVFTKKEIPTADLELIVDAGKHAPSGRNQRKRKFTVVRNPELLAEMARVLGKAIDRENYGFYRATAMILCSDEKSNPFHSEDCACALENMFLAAHSLKIGSVWINQFNGACDNLEVRELLTKLKIPTDHAIYGCAALGYGMIPKKAAFDFTEEVEWFL